MGCVDLHSLGLAAPFLGYAIGVIGYEVWKSTIGERNRNRRAKAEREKRERLYYVQGGAPLVYENGEPVKPGTEMHGLPPVP
jgi:hypothetical protein